MSMGRLDRSPLPHGPREFDLSVGAHQAATVPDTTTGDRELLTLRAQAVSGAVALTMAVWSARWIRDGHRIVWHGRR